MENTSFVPCKSGYITFKSSPSNRFIFFTANRLEKNETILFSDAVEKLVVALPKALKAAQNLTEEEIQADSGLIFFEDLSCFLGIKDPNKKPLMFKNSLSVNTYQSNVYIWIKRYFKDTDTQTWSACRGGFCFAPNVDNFEEILNFLQKQLEVVKTSKNNIKQNVAQFANTSSLSINIPVSTPPSPQQLSPQEKESTQQMEV